LGITHIVNPSILLYYRGRFVEPYIETRSAQQPTVRERRTDTPKLIMTIRVKATIAKEDFANAVAASSFTR
jgi:hypothetical protein